MFKSLLKTTVEHLFSVSREASKGKRNRLKEIKSELLGLNKVATIISSVVPVLATYRMAENIGRRKHWRI